MAAPQPPPPLTRPPLKRTQSSPAQQSRSLDIFDFALDEEMIDERSSHNGALFRDFSGAGSNPTSQTCSRCNSTGEVNDADLELFQATLFYPSNRARIAIRIVLEINDVASK